MGKRPRDDGGDGYGFDPEQSAARGMMEKLERRIEEQPDRPAKQLGEALGLPKRITLVKKRLINARAEIHADPRPDEIAYQHTVLAQTSMPYRPTDARVWERRQGNVSLLIEAGRARHPDTGKWVELALPHGEKPRLVLMHLNAEALRTGSPVIDVQDSMTAFVKALGIDPNGRNLRTLKDQLARLAAAHITLGVGPDTIKADIIRHFRVWWPPDAQQQVLWPSTVRLDPDYFANLQAHAIPLDQRAVAALAHSALDLDIYAWLAQRLHRIPRGKPQLVPWSALQQQFGPDYDRVRDFRRKFAVALKTVLGVYEAARIEPDKDGVLLRNSPPPVPPPLVSKGVLQRTKIEPPTIDGTATRLPDEPAKG